MTDIWDQAERQHGAIARWQLAAGGRSRWWVDRRIERGELLAATSNVLVVAGAPPTPDQALMIAVLDGGPGSLATMRSAGWLWGLPGFAPVAPDVIRGRGERPRDSATTRWPRHIPPHHVTSVRGIPVLTLPRTIFELAADPRVQPRLPRIIDTIHGKAPSILLALHTMLPQVAARGKTGITFMRATLDTRPPGAVPLTGVERRFEWCLTSAGIPVPRRQVDLGGHSWVGRFDYYDDDTLVIYEIDGDLNHTGRLDVLRDRARDAEALAAGFNEVVHIGEHEVWYDPDSVRQKVRDARRRHGRAAS